MPCVRIAFEDPLHGIPTRDQWWKPLLWSRSTSLPGVLPLRGGAISEVPFLGGDRIK